MVTIWALLTLLVLVVFAAFSTPQSIRIAKTTLFLGISAAVAAVPVGFWIAWVQFRTRGLLANFVFVVVISCILIPLHLYVAAWDSAFGKLGFLRGTDGRSFEPLLAGFWGAAFIQFVASVPWTTLIAAVCYRTIRRDVEDAAALDGNPVQVFWTITIRKWLPLLFLASVWVIVISSREIAATDIYQVGTFAEEIYLKFAGGRFDWFGIDPSKTEGGSFSLLAFILLSGWLFLSAMICISYWVPTRKIERHTEQRRPPGRLFLIVARISVILLFLILFVVPLVNLFIRSGSFVDSAESPTLRFSFGHSIQQMLLAPKTYWSELSWSLSLGLMTMAVVFPGALLMSWISRRRRWLAVIFFLVAALSLSLPGPLIGAAVHRISLLFDFQIWNNLFDRSIFGPLLATTIVAFGPAYLLMAFLFRNVATETLEAVEVEGSASVLSGPIRVQWLKGGVACCAICFLIGFSDLSASYIPTPPGMDTVPRRILGQMHAGVNDRTAGLCLDCLFLIGTISLLATGFLNLSSGHRAKK